MHTLDNLVKMFIALVVGFANKDHLVNEADGDVMMTIRVRGGTTECTNRVTDWQLAFHTTSMSAHCEY